jgi:thiosulfate dehydrogenase [quinone] large subunit
MSRHSSERVRRAASIRHDGRRPRGQGPNVRDGWGSDAPDPATLLQRMILALLPLRVFLGVTFVYAGVDKLIDPTFLQSTGPGSIGAQMEAFARVSPIAPLVQVVGLTFPVQLGFLIAIGEIAIGLGALTGILFRLSAAAGLALSLTFWLTASWATTPYYYGPDLPYAIGWLTLTLAGTGGRYSLETWFARLTDVDPTEPPVWDERRVFLRAGALGVAAVAVAGLAGTVGASVLGRPRPDLGDATPTQTAGDAGGVGATEAGVPTAVATPGVTATAGATADPTTAPPTGPLVAKVSQISTGHAIAFDDPISGDPGVIVRLPDGTFVAYDSVCTHAGCTVRYDRGSGYLVCPCHGATFDPQHDAEVVGGPTNQPLARIPIHIDPASGRITLTA